MLRILMGLLLLIILAVAGLFAFNYFSTPSKNQPKKSDNFITRIVAPKPTPSITLETPPPSKVLDNGGYHIFQSFNNCGPASLSIALSFYGIQKSQQELGQSLRPYQVASGDNDDKSVTLAELAEKSKEFGFIPYHRPNGNADIIKQFIAYDMPVITRTWLKVDDDIGHYRVMKGYDDNGQEFIQDDSYQNKNLKYTYEDFNKIWQKFNYEYLVLVPKEKQSIAEAILGEESDEQTAWRNAVKNAERQLSQNPDDIDARFNLSVALFHTWDYQRSVEEFEKVENRLSFRTLWYQIEPIKAYYELEKYDRVFEITDEILNNHNRAYSEAYLIRGDIYKKQGNIEAARNEYQKALLYNKNLQTAKDALMSI